MVVSEKDKHPLFKHRAGGTSVDKNPRKYNQNKIVLIDRMILQNVIRHNETKTQHIHSENTTLQGNL